MAKRYYWLRLKDDFFDEKYVKALRRLPQGDSLVIVFLKMQLKSIRTEGILKYEGIMPNCISELAMAIDEDESVVQLAVEALVRFGVVERMDNDDLYLTMVENLIGSEAASTQRSRECRERKKEQNNKNRLTDNEQALQCNTNATDMQHDCNADATQVQRREEKEKRKEKDKIEDKIEDESREDPTTASNARKPESGNKIAYGEFNHVKLTETEYKKLSEEYGDKITADYICRMDEYCESHPDVNYPNCYLQIKKWIRQDVEKGWLKLPQKQEDKPKSKLFTTIGGNN